MNPYLQWILARAHLRRQEDRGGPGRADPAPAGQQVCPNCHRALGPPAPGGRCPACGVVIAPGPKGR